MGPSLVGAWIEFGWRMDNGQILHLSRIQAEGNRCHSELTVADADTADLCCDGTSIADLHVQRVPRVDEDRVVLVAVRLGQNHRRCHAAGSCATEGDGRRRIRGVVNKTHRGTVGTGDVGSVGEVQRLRRGRSDDEAGG